MTQEEQKAIENEFYVLLKKNTALTDAEIDRMRQLLAMSSALMVREHILGMAQLRSQLDLIGAIRGFERASSTLVETTNRLTRWILLLTVAGAVVGIANAVATGWPWAVWWVKHGLRFR
jgi:hypothetical protein